MTINNNAKISDWNSKKPCPKKGKIYSKLNNGKTKSIYTQLSNSDFHIHKPQSAKKVIKP